MIQRTIKLENDIRIVLISDLHVGQKGFREDIFDDMLKELEVDGTYALCLGDVVEGREPSHKFYDPNEVVMTVGEQYEYVLAKLRPYKDKILGIHPGNHEDSLIIKTTINPLLQFCNDNKIPYLGAVARTVFVNEAGKPLTILSTHGAGGGASAGGPLNRVISYAKSFNPDIVCVGHFHKLMHTCELHSEMDGQGKLKWSPMHIVVNGSALESYTDGSFGNYAERKNLQPNCLGYAVLTITKDLEVKVDLKPY